MGQKLAAYNVTGIITGYYDTVDSPAPNGVETIEITNSQWQACISSQLPYTVANGALLAPGASALLAQAQDVQASALSLACSRSIVGGFTSSALGSAYSYPSNANDQANQVTIAASASGGLLWCANSGGTWALVQHTQAQAQAVQASFSAWLNACQQQLVALSNQVANASTVAAAQSVAWVAP
jgi:hypothetical protein